MRSFSILLAMGLVLAAGSSRAEQPFDPVLAELGAEAFPRYCASCHGVQAKGDGPAASALIKKPADLTRIAARRGGKFPDGEIARFIDGRFTLAAHGSREMPIWGERFADSVPDSGVAEEISRGRIAVLVEYLKSIQRKD